MQLKDHLLSIYILNQRTNFTYLCLNPGKQSQHAIPRMPSPLTTTLIQSTLLNALSNILAQIIAQHKKDVSFLNLP
jgi:hypothetical protein